MNWKSLMHTYKMEGSEVAKQALMHLTMKKLKQLAENRCVIQLYQRVQYAGSEKKSDLIAEILPYVKCDLEAEENPSEGTLQRRFLNEGLRTLFQQFRTAYPNTKIDHFWYLIQNAVPSQRWDNGKYESSSVTRTWTATSKRKSEPQKVEEPIFTEKIDGANLKKILYL